MDLSIIIVSWNTRDLLAQCLKSVKVAGISTEVFVVDNASTDGSPHLVRECFPNVKLIENSENVGFAKANNQAMHQAQGRYVILLNSDTKVYSGALETLTKFMEASPQAGAAGPCLLNADGSLQPSCHPMLTPGREFWRLAFLDRLWPRATYAQERWDRETPRQVEVIKGACLALRRAALEQIGLLDEGYFMYTEEVDLCYRLIQAGWQLWWVPQAKVTHYEGQSSRQMAERMFVQLYRSKVQFFQKFGGSRRVTLFKRLVQVAYWPRLGIARAIAPFSPRWATRAHTFHKLLTELPRM